MLVREGRWEVTDYEKILAEESGITKEEAIENVAIATGFSPDCIRNSMGSLIAAKIAADELITKIKTLSNGLIEAKRPVSPYTKFDKYHKRRRRK